MFLGSPIISIISEVMLSEEIYFNFKKCQGYLFFEKPDVLQFHKTTVKYFKDAVQVIIISFILKLVP